MSTVLLLCWRDSGHPQGGGSEHYLETMGEALAHAGHRVFYRTAAYPGAPAQETRNGIRFSRGGNRITVYPRALADHWRTWEYRTSSSTPKTGCRSSLTW